MFAGGCSLYVPVSDQIRRGNHGAWTEIQKWIFRGMREGLSGGMSKSETSAEGSNKKRNEREIERLKTRKSVSYMGKWEWM